MTATFDPATQEFVLNSPTVTSTKVGSARVAGAAPYSLPLTPSAVSGGRAAWARPAPTPSSWPACSPRASTAACTPSSCSCAPWRWVLGPVGVGWPVHAPRLPLSHAPSIHPPVSQDHRSLPGIEVGDIGAKLGYVTNDNVSSRRPRPLSSSLTPCPTAQGFLRLHHARIPRENMLMRYATVAPDGAYSRPPHDKLVYGTMIFVRSYMMVRRPLRAAFPLRAGPRDPSHPSSHFPVSWTRPAASAAPSASRSATPPCAASSRAWTATAGRRWC